MWQRDPVTAAELVKRLDAKLGVVDISRDFDGNGMKYRWTTPHDTAVELSEPFSIPGRYWLSLRAWRL